MRMNVISRLLTFFLVVVLLVSPINNYAFAANSKNVAQPEFDVDRVAEVILESPEGDQISTTMFLTNGTELDESDFESLGEGYQLKELKIRDLDPNEFDFQEVAESNLSTLAADKKDGVIKPQWVETAFDVGNFMLSLADYRAEPTLWNGFKVVFDGASVVFPGVPAISGVERMIRANKTLKKALEIGIDVYDNLKNIPSGWHRHHIFEKRFAKRLGTHEDDMFCIAIPKEYHDPITKAMRKEIPYGIDYNQYSRAEILETHIDVYRKLWRDTDDEVYEFLYKFAREKQHSIR